MWDIFTLCRQSSSPHCTVTCYNLKLQGSKTKAKLFPTKNDKENKTNISLTINGKKDENIKILPQKRTKVIFYIDNCLFEKNSKFLSSKSCSLVNIMGTPWGCIKCKAIEPLRIYSTIIFYCHTVYPGNSFSRSKISNFSQKGNYRCKISSLSIFEGGFCIVIIFAIYSQVY